jgi:hypothetical protein
MNERQHYVASPRVLLLAGAFLTLFGGVGAWSFISSLHPLLWKSAPCELLVFNPTDDPKSGGNPKNAVLFRPVPKWDGIAFIVFSGCIGWILYHAHRGRDLPTDALGAKVMPAVGILFGGAGLFMLLRLSLPVWIETFQVRTWEEKPAKIIWSESRVSGSGSKQTRRADICYEYNAAGKTWRNNGLYPGCLGAGNFGGTDALIGDHPPGSSAICRVDPERPERALLFTNAGWSMVFTLFPLPFLAIGGMVLKSLVRRRKE